MTSSIETFDIEDEKPIESSYPHIRRDGRILHALQLLILAATIWALIQVVQMPEDKKHEVIEKGINPQYALIYLGCIVGLQSVTLIVSCIDVHKYYKIKLWRWSSGILHMLVALVFISPNILMDMENAKYFLYTFGGVHTLSLYPKIIFVPLGWIMRIIYVVCYPLICFCKCFVKHCPRGHYEEVIVKKTVMGPYGFEHIKERHMIFVPDRT